MNENIERVLTILDGFRMSDEITYSVYSALYDEISLLDDLLKEQEPVEPIEQTETITRYKCGFCGNRLYLKEHKFCHWCGKAVKWDEDD